MTSFVVWLALAAIALGSASAFARGGAREHTIAAGETLWKIAQKYGCSTAQVEKANPRVNPSLLRIGQRISIPACKASATEPSEIRRERDRGRPSTTPSGRAPSRLTHTVKAGDYLERIAKRYDCSVEAIQRANGLRTDVIYVGTKLAIPDCRKLPPAPPVVRPAPFQPRPQPGLDQGTLAQLLQAVGFKPPPKFKAYVHLIEFDAARSRIAKEKSWDWNGTGSDVAGWNPASTVKLFAAVAALMKAQQWGFSPRAEIIFHAGAGPVRYTLEQLITDAVGPSDNIAYNWLVLFSGFDWLHKEFFAPKFGLDGAALRRAYERRRWMTLGQSPSFRESPPMSIQEGHRKRDVPRRESERDVGCHSAACASLASLAECMRRLMLQEQLPDREGFGLQRDYLIMLRGILRTGRKRGEEVVDALSAHFPSDQVRLYHKAGFAEDWYSDVVYIYDPGNPKAWIVALAGWPGRSSLTAAADAIGALIAGGNLR